MGSTNFDHRSFALNDEVNLAVLDRPIGGRRRNNYFDDLKQSYPLNVALLQQSALLGTDESWVDDILRGES